MEEAQGQQLEDLWDTLDPEIRGAIVEDLVSVEKKLLAASFNWYAT